MTRKLLSVLLFTAALMGSVKTELDTHDYNELEEGEEFDMDEFDDDLIENPQDSLTEEERPDETAEWDIAHEKDTGMAHIHITFRNKYLGKRECESDDKNCWKNKQHTPKDIYETQIAPLVEYEGTDVEKLDASKPLIKLNKKH